MLKKFKNAVTQSVVLLHAKVVKAKDEDIKTDSGSIIESAGMWIVGLLGVALILYGFRDIISNTIIPSIASNITALFSNIPKP